MTPAQLTLYAGTLKTAILADASLAAARAVSDWPAIEIVLNAPNPTTYIVWRTNLNRSDIYHATSPEATTWDWATYKAQAAPEQGAWLQMFVGDTLNMSLANLRTGVEKIFGAANAQTAHIKAAGKRQATYFEKILSAGSGTLVSPSVMAVEGIVTAAEIQKAMTT